MTSQRLRVVLDINVLVSGALSDHNFLRRKYGPGGSPELEWSEDAPDAALLLKRVGRCQLCVSQPLLDEWERVRRYEKFKGQLLGPESSGSRVDYVLEEAVVFTPIVVVDVCRDPNDNYLLALSEEACASFLITDDADLLALKRWSSAEILTPQEFFAANPHLR